MTPDAIARIRTSFAGISGEPRALASRFYTELFAAAPHLRSLFPDRSHVSAGTLRGCARAGVQNLEEMRTLEQPLRDLGAQHVRWGAKPEDYAIVREALIRAIRLSSAGWADTLEADWRRAITEIAVPMLQGAAVHTAMIAERLSEE